MKLVLISDTHGDHYSIKNIPDGDVIIHCGDFVGDHRYMIGYNDFIKWFASLPHKHKLLIAGNHDVLFEHAQFTREVAELLLKYPTVTYLEDSGVTIDGIKFWGSPVQPEFFNWAFNRDENRIKPHWDAIPEDTNVLVTHGPMRGVLDRAPRDPRGKGFEYAGCEYMKHVIETKLKKLKLHCFGHIHAEYGSALIDGVMHVNCSLLDESYTLVNKPFVFHID